MSHQKAGRYSLTPPANPSKAFLSFSELLFYDFRIITQKQLFKWLLCCESNADLRIQSPLSWPLDDKEDMVVLPGHAPGSDAYKAPALLLSYRTGWHPDFDSNKDLRCWRPLFCRWTIGIWRCTQDSNPQVFRPTDFKSAPSPPGHAALWRCHWDLNPDCRRERAVN